MALRREPAHRGVVPNASRCSRLTPCAQIDGAHYQTKNVRGNEAKLFRSEADDADEHAIDASQRPAFPTSAPHQNRGRDG